MDETGSCPVGRGNNVDLSCHSHIPELWQASPLNHIGLRCSFRSLFNMRLQAERTKSIRVGALIGIYLPTLVLGFECQKTKSGHYSRGTGTH
jgi:hypothetical protein